MQARGCMAFGLARCRRAGAPLRCLDLGMVPSGPSVAGWIWGARAPLYSMVRGCHEAWQGAGVTGQSRFKWIQLGSSTALPQETRSRVAFSGERGQNFYLPVISAHFRPLHFRSFSATAADICNLVSRQACGEWGFENRNSVQHSFQVRDSS